MRRPLGRLLAPLLGATLLLTACGGDSEGGNADDRAEDSASSSPSPTPSEEGTGIPGDTEIHPHGHGGEGWALVEIVQATAAGGEVSTTPGPIGEPAQLAEFTAQFDRPDMAEEIEHALGHAEHSAGEQVVAAVIAIGCDVPPGVTYEDGEVRPLKVTNPRLECFAPVTSVAILTVQPDVR